MEERDHARGAPLNISHGVVDVGLVRHVSVRRRFWDNRTGRKRLRSADRFVSRRGYLSSETLSKLRLSSQSRGIWYLRFKGKRSLISGIGTRINLVSQSRGNLSLSSKGTGIRYLTLSGKVSLLRVVRSGIKLSPKLSLGSRLRSREVLSTLSRSTAHYVQAFIVFVEDNLTFFPCVFSDRSRRTSYLLFFNDILISH